MALFEDNCMQANADKFQVSLISRDPTFTGITLQINDVILKSTELVNIPGANIDNKSTFHQHTSDLCGRTSYQLCTLSRFSGVSNIEVSSKLLLPLMCQMLCIVH